MDAVIYAAIGIALLIRYHRNIKKNKQRTESTSAHEGCSQNNHSLHQHRGTQTENDAVESAFEDNYEMADEPVEQLTPEADGDADAQQADDLQALREQAYVDFMMADDSDFTAGPARFVVASDGVQDCGALLVPIPLCQDIQELIEEQRTYANQEQVTSQELSALARLEGKTKLEISNYELRISQAKETGADAEGISSMQDKLDNLRLMLEDVKIRQETANEQLASEAMNLRNCQACVNKALEEAFVAAALAAPPSEEPIPAMQDLDLQDEYAAFCQRQQEVDDDPPHVEPLEICGDEVFEVTNDHLTPEELLPYEIRDAFHAARDQLLDAQRHFDRREIDRETARQTTEATEEEFDIQWVQRFRELTTELIDAEAVFTAARAAALEAQVEIQDDDQWSMFVDREDDGYPLSHEDGCIASAPRSRIDKWRDEIPFGADPEHAVDAAGVDVDEWDARDVDVSDSCSCVETGPYRSKIDEMRQRAGV